MAEIRNLSKQINFNYLVHYFKFKVVENIFIDFKDQFCFFSNVNKSYASLKKPEKIKRG